MEKLLAMARAVNGIALRVRTAWEENNFQEVSKAVFQKRMSFLPKELAGASLQATGDNWLWPSAELNQEESLYPDLSASVALTERDEKGNILRCAMAPVAQWNQLSVAANRNALYILNRGGFFPIAKVNPALLDDPPRAYVFGQKSTDHWVAMNRVIGEMNRQGIRTQNDCGPYYGLLSWFNNFDDGQAAIIPRNVAYIEPYNNKPKEELMAFLIDSLNNGLEDGRFILATMAGGPVFDGGVFQGKSAEIYSSAGFIIAPDEKSYRTVLSAFRKAVLKTRVFSSPKANEKIKKLKQDLE